MYSIANTTVTILRGTEPDSFGDAVDDSFPVAEHVIAFISYPTMSPLRPIVLGLQVFETTNAEPSITRLAACALPYGTNVLTGDQILDEMSKLVYEVYAVTALGFAGAFPDLVLTLKRVTSTEIA